MPKLRPHGSRSWVNENVSTCIFLIFFFMGSYVAGSLLPCLVVSSSPITRSFSFAWSGWSYFTVSLFNLWSISMCPGEKTQNAVATVNDRTGEGNLNFRRWVRILIVTYHLETKTPSKLNLNVCVLMKTFWERDIFFFSPLIFWWSLLSEWEAIYFASLFSSLCS